MMWRSWNKADKTLLAAVVIFCFALCLNLQYRDNVFARGFLFCAEAALVGGIADWFAVTALFEKPLGFPWHTAILPRRRQSFIEATGRMLQQEFFGRKILIKKIKKLDFAAMVLAWLGKEQTQHSITNWAVGRLPEWMQKYGRLPARGLGQTSAMELNVSSLRPVADYAIHECCDFAQKPEFQAKTKDILEKYMDSKLQGPMAMMMAGFAKSVDIINVDEAAQLLQKKLVRLLEAVQREDTAEYAQLQDSLDRLCDFYEKNLAVKQELNAVLLNETGKLDFCEYLLHQNDQMQGEVMKELGKLLEEIIKKVVLLLSDNAVFKEELNALVYQIAARSALQAQDLLGGITHDVLGTMTDQQINSLVYDKAEPDLLWIRMNGSIVGATIGLVVFVVIQFI